MAPSLLKDTAKKHAVPQKKLGNGSGCRLGMLLLLSIAITLLPGLCSAESHSSRDTDDACDTSVDYFPVKLAADHSRGWDVEYKKYYKIATFYLKGKAHRYVLVRKGCPAPSVGFEPDATVTIPVAKAGFSSSTFHAYLEILGARSSLKAMSGNFATTPCLNKMAEDSQITDYKTNQTVLSELDVFFADQWTSYDSLTSLSKQRFVTVGPGLERDLIPQLEWLEFFSLFFDKEKFVQQYVGETESAMLCLTSKVLMGVAKLTQDGGRKVRVLWGTPNEQGVWSLGTCPNYYCEAIESAGGEVLNKRKAVTSLEAKSTKALFAAGVAGDADVILVGPSYHSTTYAALTSKECRPLYDAIPSTVPAAANKNIWDFGKGRVGPSGGLDWFSSRLAEPDVLVEELADIFYPTMKIKGSLAKHWWQNAYTEGMCDPGVSMYMPIKDSAAQCSDVAAPLVPKRNTHCKDVSLQALLPFARDRIFPGMAPITDDACDTSVDYFPVKLAADHSRGWDVEYKKYYKIATFYLKGKAHRYVLVRKGCPAPSVGFEPDATVTIPVAKAGFSSSTFHAYLEILGARSSLKAMSGNFATTPCLNKMAEDSQITDYKTNQTVLSELDVFFADQWTSYDSLTSLSKQRFVTVGPGLERDLIPQLEWLEFFSLFFDKEKFVQQYVGETESAMLCLTSKVLMGVAKLTQDGGRKVRVLWGTPNEQGVWSLGTCPNYYCEAIESAGGEVLNKRKAVTSLEAKSTKALFAAGVAGDADVILVGPSYHSTTYAALTSKECRPLYDAIPSTVPAAANKNIWDFGKGRVGPSGGLDWFSSRLAEPDVLVEELADIFYPTMKIKGSLAKHWWQNAYTEGMCDPGVSMYMPIKDSAAQCSDVAAPLVPKRNTHCKTKPSLKGIVPLAVGTAALRSLVTALTLPDQQPVLAVLNGTGPLTVFAPTNPAFEALKTLKNAAGTSLYGFVTDPVNKAILVRIV